MPGNIQKRMACGFKLLCLAASLVVGLACSKTATMDQQIAATREVVKTIQELGIEARISAEIGGATYYGLFEGVVIDPGIRVTVTADLDPGRAKKLDAILAALEGLKEPDDEIP